ncbi:SDR family oxidoreductase [Streptomyces sp. NPDC051320]|uniref:SDR family oxidoreductase n=1 Tax=Streptomyces sp. NPDC051320 TaxID=3154644 RepID=UPI00344650B7
MSARSSTPSTKLIIKLNATSIGNGTSVPWTSAHDTYNSSAAHSDRHRRSTRHRRRRRSAAQSIPVGRVGEPEDVAHTASFLVSREAGFVSGQVIYVAGGPVD